MKRKNLDEFYIKRINWLVSQDRDDLIPSVVDEYEREQPALPPASIVINLVEARLRGCP